MRRECAILWFEMSQGALVGCLRRHGGHGMDCRLGGTVYNIVPVKSKHQHRCVQARTTIPHPYLVYFISRIQMIPTYTLLPVLMCNPGGFDQADNFAVGLPNSRGEFGGRKGELIDSNPQGHRSAYLERNGAFKGFIHHQFLPEHGASLNFSSYLRHHHNPPSSRSSQDIGPIRGTPYLVLYICLSAHIRMHAS
jgi:hypothetical protein